MKDDGEWFIWFYKYYTFFYTEKAIYVLPTRPVVLYTICTINTPIFFFSCYIRHTKAENLHEKLFSLHFLVDDSCITKQHKYIKPGMPFFCWQHFVARKNGI